MNKNSSKLMEKKPPITKLEVNENNQPGNHQLNINVNKAYEMALFKKRIMWQATIFALKIVIPVVILAVIFMKFLE